MFLPLECGLCGVWRVKELITTRVSSTLRVLSYGNRIQKQQAHTHVTQALPRDHPVTSCPRFRPEPDFLSGAGTGLSRSPAPRERNATTQTTHTALRRGSCCTLCSRPRPQLRRWKAASEAPQRGRGRRMRFCYSQLELAALPEVEGDAQKNDILTGRVSPKLALDATKEGGS